MVLCFITALSLTILRYDFRDLNHKNIKLTPFSIHFLRMIVIIAIWVVFNDVKITLSLLLINKKHFNEIG
ncbi:hypothetical protein GBL98_03730 [Yersinia pseudotuberculosis]|uniref:Uncharacterized protein n=1 Tax=Yersinia pseudotuberculosis TaxID=633 RepID=A0ABM7AKT6_YERPU|nr:hypothetical protein CEQ20_05820 [Yersinia pseudotuberculosis]AYW88035.1 hypothetical protein EGX87_13095 [Yersinia pseudotuberculosis]AYW93183.1 hypothetical protein EGX47_18925 [Yersinia pseudotuberculosis]AYW97344.1 hypothetical protein EGX39_16920 [Yersinia pseudotuberculosis]AYW98782.1 hypothetical protein EGX53_02240 [Yersinia pseudotuberculosis]